MVAGGVVLLEAGLMLFINDDHAEMRSWGKHRTPGSDDDLHASRGDLLPVTVAFGIRQMAMQD